MEREGELPSVGLLLSAHLQAGSQLPVCSPEAVTSLQRSVNHVYWTRLPCTSPANHQASHLRGAVQEDRCPTPCPALPRLLLWFLLSPEAPVHWWPSPHTSPRGQTSPSTPRTRHICPTLLLNPT